MRCILLLAACLACQGLYAQASGSLSLASDYRYRGVSLSGDQPAVQGELDMDFAGGAYAGLFASKVRLYDGPSSQLQASAFAGYAQRIGAGWSVDGGASYAAFSGEREVDYAELHAGVSTQGLEGRLSISPNYFGQSLRTWYAELNGSQALFDPLRLVWHAGELGLASGAMGAPHTNADARLGIEFAWRALRLQFARVQNQGSTYAYPVSYSERDHGAWLGELSGVF
jgi:uncharacterized protein (TIGR02001 family)